MSVEQNKAILRRIPEEVFNKGNLAIADEIFAADYVEHVPLPPGLPAGLEGLKQFVTIVRSAFPDFHYTIDDVIAEGDQVVFRLTARGTQQGEFMGIPPTGKQATWTEIHIGRAAGGKLVEHWANYDHLGMLQQLGVVPAPAGA
ncbi:MAG: ester cyclase [Chloroflexi bacterium]|nr:ester cyclase [Chloroflexota bacterium]